MRELQGLQFKVQRVEGAFLSCGSHLEAFCFASNYGVFLLSSESFFKRGTLGDHMVILFGLSGPLSGLHKDYFAGDSLVGKQAWCPKRAQHGWRNLNKP